MTQRTNDTITINYTGRTAITTKYLPYTNYRSPRIKATSSSGKSVTVSWDHGLNADENHAAAAIALCNKMEWSAKSLTMAWTKDNGIFILNY